MAAEAGTTSRDRPLIGAGLDTFGGSPFVQERLALLGKVIFLLSFGFFVIINGLFFLGGHVPLGRLLGQQHNVWHLLASSMMGALWLAARVRPWSLHVLGGLDAGSVFLGGSGLAIMAAQPSGELLLTALLALTVTLLARAVLVPSTALRTAIVSGLAGLPIFAVSILYDQPSPAAAQFPGGFLEVVASVNCALWLLLVVSLSTVASRTIYGLRQQVREAREIGQYILEEKIGGGGMGEIWRARHRMLIRPAAVKLIRPQAIGSAPGRDPALLARRFEREARATAGLKSPHTVQLYDFGVTDDGTLYYVMELLDGMDLDTLIKRFGPVPAERAVHLLLQVCASLEDAHQNGLVHRDIKPANVVVGHVGVTADFVKVLDFGLVKLESTRPKDDGVRLTTDGSVSGTPGFMAPEIALGEEANDHRVDIYSLGCVGYWLLTGRLVFEGPTAMKVMLAHAHEAPPPPSARVELPIPPALEAVILDCLKKDPGERPASAAALSARLQAIPLATPWTRERADRWWSVHAPGATASRPIAEMLLSQEARPVRVIRQANFTQVDDR